MSCVTFRKIQSDSICTEWKLEGCLNFERNNTHREKIIPLCGNYWHFIRFSTEGQQKSTYLLFWKEFWNRNQSVATWLVSRQQFPSLLQGNNVFFCFCKCCLYWVNPSMLNSDNILWTSNEKMHLQKPEHNRVNSLNSYLVKETHHIHDSCWHYIFWLLTWENANFYELYLIHSIYFVNKHVQLLPFLTVFEGLRHIKSNKCQWKCYKMVKFSPNTDQHPSITNQGCIHKMFFHTSFFTLFLFAFFYKKRLLLCPLSICYDPLVKVQKNER